jgi:Rieske Fe-S protein
MPDVDQDATAARPDRRSVIRGAGAVGIAAVGATALAACGSDSSVSAPSGAPASSSPGSSSSAPTTTTSSGSGAAGGIAKADIPVGGGTIFPATKTVVTQPTAGQFKAFSSVCTHMGCPLAQVADGTINCNCHGSRFDIATGKVRRGPAAKPLPAKEVTVKGDRLTVT